MSESSDIVKDIMKLHPDWRSSGSSLVSLIRILVVFCKYVVGPRSHSQESVSFSLYSQSYFLCLLVKLGRFCFSFFKALVSCIGIFRLWSFAGLEDVVDYLSYFISPSLELLLYLK